MPYSAQPRRARYGSRPTTDIRLARALRRELDRLGFRTELARDPTQKTDGIIHYYVITTAPEQTVLELEKELGL